MRVLDVSARDDDHNDGSGTGADRGDGSAAAANGDDDDDHAENRYSLLVALVVVDAPAPLHALPFRQCGWKCGTVVARRRAVQPLRHNG